MMVRASGYRGTLHQYATGVEGNRIRIFTGGRKMFNDFQHSRGKEFKEGKGTEAAGSSVVPIPFIPFIPVSLVG
jgi:hypothetical protein